VGKGKADIQVVADNSNEHQVVQEVDDEPEVHVDGTYLNF